MTRITNPKLRGGAPPTWKPYPGISLLYDGPGCAALSGVERLDRLAAAPDRDDTLYRRLESVADELTVAARDAGMTVCPLPAATYHVTLCDGVNAGVRGHVHGDRLDEVTATLDGLPDSLSWCNGVLRLLQDQEVRFSVWRDPVAFRAAGLEVRGHALVAAVVPADGPSVAARDRHEASRAEVAARLRDRYGIETQPWAPHVTLAYFANADDAARARDALVPGWQERLRSRTAGITVTFRSAAVYGFTDMVTYWRVGR